MGLRVAVLVKQVPKFEGMALGPDGRLQRDGLELELNPYCRRAVSKGVELAAGPDGACTVFTLGPRAAEDSLREAVAWGADEGVLVSDPAFAGSDTLASAKTLAAALRRRGEFDLVLLGRNSVDADTGQVGPEVAELLDLPFLGGVRQLELRGRVLWARCEHDDGWTEIEAPLPAVASCAERLCSPAKVEPAAREAVPAQRIGHLAADDLGRGPWGHTASPTSVGEVRRVETARRRILLSGPVAEQAFRAVEELGLAAAPRTDARPRAGAEPVPDGWDRSETRVGVVVEPRRAGTARELLGTAARIARAVRGRVVALCQVDDTDPATAMAWGADEIVALHGSDLEEDLAAAIGDWCRMHRPWSLLAPGTMWGREIAARAAARLDAGLTGDAVDLTTADGRLVAWKPAFGGSLVAAITSASPVQIVTVRPGVLPRRQPRQAGPSVRVTTVRVPSGSQVRRLARGRDDELDELGTARVVLGVGQAVDPRDYPLLTPLQRVLNAQLGATRKVTDNGWLPRARQLGITGRSIAPDLYVAIGLSGKFNHMVSIRGARTVLAINNDPRAHIFDAADIGIVADWKAAVPLLAAAITADDSTLRAVGA